MASTRRLTAKDGRDFYEIRVRMGRQGATLSMRWYVPDGWSQKAIDRELARVAADFERRCKAGEVLTRAQNREEAAREALERAKIKTVRQYAEQVYFPQKAVVVSRRTLASYKWTFEKYVFPAPLCGMLMEEVTPAQLTAFLLGIQAQGQAHSSVVRLYAVLSGFFKAAYLDDTISKNPMDKVQKPTPRKDELKREGPEAYTESELAYILDCLQAEPLKWRALVSLLIETGIRRGECCALRWSDIDFKAHRITISGSLSYTPAEGVYLDTPKNGRTRVVSITSATAALLLELRREQAQKAVSAWVFTQDGSPEPMHPDSPTRYLAAMGKRYGIEHLHPHKLRHSFASVAITNGADVVSVSELLGHSDTAITLRTYSHANSESLDRASGIFQNAIQQKRNEKGRTG